MEGSGSVPPGHFSERSSRPALQWRRHTRTVTQDWCWSFDSSDNAIEAQADTLRLFEDDDSSITCRHHPRRRRECCQRGDKGRVRCQRRERGASSWVIIEKVLLLLV